MSIPLSRKPDPVYADPIYTVALVEDPVPNFEPPKPTRRPEPPKPEPEPAPEPPKPEPKPPEPDPVVIPKPDPPKPEPKPDPPKPKPKPKPDPPKPEPEPKVEPKPEPVPEKAPDIPEAPPEPVSVGMVDQEDFRDDNYLRRVKAIIARKWFQRQPGGSDRDALASVHLVILRDGTIRGPRIKDASGWSLFDRAALGTLLDIPRLPPLPQSYRGDELGLTVEFVQRTGSP